MSTAIVQSYDNGEPESARMARNLLEPERVAMSPSLQQVQGELQKRR